MPRSSRRRAVQLLFGAPQPPKTVRRREPISITTLSSRPSPSCTGTGRDHPLCRSESCNQDRPSRAVLLDLQFGISSFLTSIHSANGIRYGTQAGHCWQQARPGETGGQGRPCSASGHQTSCWTRGGQGVLQLWRQGPCQARGGPPPRRARRGADLRLRRRGREGVARRQGADRGAGAFGWAGGAACLHQDCIGRGRGWAAANAAGRALQRRVRATLCVPGGGENTQLLS
jgi:hypothetical protein